MQDELWTQDLSALYAFNEQLKVNRGIKNFIGE